MFTCLLIKRKLYDYIDNALSEVEHSQVQAHLEKCDSCQKKAADLRQLLAVAQSKKTPVPSAEFWHQFKVELDAKLNEQLVPPLRFRPLLGFRLKPAFAMPLVSIMVVVIMVSLYFHNRHPFITESETQLFDEINFLEEVSPDTTVLTTDEMYTEDLTLVP